MTKTDSKQPLSLFAQTVEAALELYQDARMLGETSLLAAPYLLAQYLEQPETSAEERGNKLKTILAEAVEAMEGKYKERYQTLIREYYFKKKRSQEVLLILNLAERQFYTDRREAIVQLSTILIGKLRPALLLESPPIIQCEVLGRKTEMERGVCALSASQTVAITGGGGVGKTTLGSYLASQWDKAAVFWFTVRPGLNDHPDSLVFALAYFLKSLDESILWQEVLTDSRNLANERIAEIARVGLQNLHKRAINPLLCFDEIDLLQPDQQVEHQQLLAFVDMLRKEAAVLVIGQKVLLEAQEYLLLNDLTETDMQRKLRQEANIALQPGVSQLLYAYTHGNPRLVELFMTLYLENEPLAGLLQQMQNTPPLEFFLSRIIRRLTPQESSVVKALSVFRNSAPAEIWQDQAMIDALKHLVQKHLVLPDRIGGVALHQAYRSMIYALLTPEDRQQLHLIAANIRAQRATYTAAAYHWIQAGQPEIAIAQWSMYGDQEVSQGQSHNAYQLFRDLEAKPLPDNARAQQRLICANLARLQGNTQQALQDIRSVFNSTPIPAMDGYRLAGEIANDASEFSQAREYFQAALKLAETVLETRMAILHKGISWGHYRQSNFDLAWRELQIARYEVENLQGLLEEETCNYQAAEDSYQIALKVAQELGHKEGIAKTANNFSKLLAKQGRFAEAQTYYRQAEEGYTVIGKVLALYGVKINWALNCNLASNYEAALAALHDAEKVCSDHKTRLPSYPKMLTHLGMAEAYLGLHDLVQAESHIRQAIELEEDDLIPESYRVYGEILFARGEFEAAERQFHQALNAHNLYTQADSYTKGYIQRALAKVYYKIGKLNEASIAKTRAIELFNEIKLTFEVERTHQTVNRG